MPLATMCAAVLIEPGRFELREIPTPQPGPDDVLIQVERCGVCGTDVHIFRGHYARDRLPLVPGHELAGTVAVVGERVVGLQPGTPVTADINIGCGRCFFCRRNEVLSCPQVSQLGIHRNGGFAEYVAAPARLAIPLPKGMPAAVAVLAEPLACVVRSHRKARLQPLESVLVIGAGPIGLLHVQHARQLGAAPVIVLEPNLARAALAREFGADLVLTAADGAREAVLGATDGRGVDVAVECVGKVELYERAFGYVRKGGRVVAFGLEEAGKQARFEPFGVVLNELTLMGSVAGMGEDMHDALTLLRWGRIATERYRADVRPLAEMQAAIEAFITDSSIIKVQISPT